MLIVALLLALIGLASLVAAVVTSNELIAWVCIGASGLGVLLLVFDAIRDRARRLPAPLAEYAEQDATGDEIPSPQEDSDLLLIEDHPDEVVHDEPDYDMPSDDEAEYPEPAEEDAVHIVSEDDVAAEATTYTDVEAEETDERPGR